MAFYCHQCGTGLPSGARFCSSCGTVVSMAAPQAGRPLVRPLVGRQIAGVCLAVARSNGWDVTAVRIITVVAFLFSSGLVGVAYLAGWIGIPEEPLPMPPGYGGAGYPGQGYAGQGYPGPGYQGPGYSGPGYSGPGNYPPQV